MSMWTYIYGTITVRPLGRTQEEKEYILKTVLNHLPVVTGSESDMEVIVNLNVEHDSSSSHDEFCMRTNNLRDRYGNRSYEDGWLRCTESYLLTISSSLRDRYFKETVKEFENWLDRLAKRVWVEDILVKIKGYGDEVRIIDNADPYNDMFEDPSWCNPTGEPNWCEYLMWRGWKDYSLPLAHVYKYYDDAEADEEFEKTFLSGRIKG